MNGRFSPLPECGSHEGPTDLMNTNLLLIVTAVVELPAGAALLIAPSLTTELMLGAGLGSPAAAMVGRVAGAALVSIGLSCWLERDRVRSGPRTGLVTGLLAYNISIPVLLTYAAVVENISGIAFWPGIGLHSILTIWCVASLRSGDPKVGPSNSTIGKS